MQDSSEEGPASQGNPERPAVSPNGCPAPSSCPGLRCTPSGPSQCWPQWVGKDLPYAGSNGPTSANWSYFCLLYRTTQKNPKPFGLLCQCLQTSLKSPLLGQMPGFISGSLARSRLSTTRRLAGHSCVLRKDPREGGSRACNPNPSSSSDKTLAQSPLLSPLQSGKVYCSVQGRTRFSSNLVSLSPL